MSASPAAAVGLPAHTHRWYIRQAHPLKRTDGLSVVWACLDCRAERVTTAVLPVPDGERQA
jgi:hypothetical protein